MTEMRVNPTRLLVFAAAVSLVQCEFKLVVMHTNDMHSRFEDTNAHSGPCVKGRGACYGGFARLKTAVTESRSKAKAAGYNSIFLNAGDNFQGTVYYTMFKWHVVSELVNMLGFDALSLGNHEFDDGPQGLVPYLIGSTAPIVCSNIDYSKEPILASNTSLTKFTPSTVLDVGGTKVGVIGYLTPDTMFLSQTGGVKLHDEIPSITKEVKKLKDQGVKILIAVGHSGYPVDKKIAEQVPDLDVVVGGHTNTFLYTGSAPDIEKIEGPYPTVVTQSSGRKVLVVTAYAYTKYLGHLQLTFDDNGEVVKSDGNPILVTESFKKDGEVEQALQKYTEKVKKEAGMQVGKSLTFLEADDKTCRLRECNFGNLVTDAIIDANAKDFKAGTTGWTNAPLAFVQGGALRTSIDNDLSGGAITYADLITTLPFTNSVERLVITGEILKKLLEHSVEGYDPEARPGAFMQFSGMRVDYDLSNSKGNRVKTAMVRCGNCTVPTFVPLDPSQTYHVLTITFLADGGDDYVMLKEASERTTLSFSDVDSVMNYLLKKSPVHPEISRRITFLGKSDPNTASNNSYSVIISLLCLTAWKILTVPLLGRG